MRRLLPALLFLVFVIPSFTVSAMATEEGSAIENSNSNVNWLKFAVMKDGKRIGSKLVYYGIYKINNKWEGHWNDVGFYKYKSANKKTTRCTVYHYSTKEGTLKNIKVTPNQITFDLEPSPLPVESAKVIIKPPGKDYPGTPNVRVVHVDPEGVEEWIVTERIILPFPEIWGTPNSSE